MAMEKKWYVKNTANKVFGPIDLETLKGWVKDGRIEPLAGISSDLKNWMLAPLKPELEMNWIVENEPGQFYGPTHRTVLDDLKKAGSLSREARFFQDDRGASAELIRTLESALSAKDERGIHKGHLPPLIRARTLFSSSRSFSIFSISSCCR